MKLHIAKDGDSIFTLSEKYGVAPDAIRSANPQLNEDEGITRGVKVKIPVGPVKPTVAAQAPAAIAHEAPNAGSAVTLPALEGLTPTTAPVAPESFASPHEKENVQISGAGNAVPLPAPTAPPAANGAEALPSYYKTELPAASHSPMHVKWSGMEGEAVHPFAPLPTPVVPAGAPVPTFYPGFGYGAPAFGGVGLPDPSAYATYGASLDPYAPAIPAYPVYPGTAPSGDCGCGASAAPRLPYALPLRSAPQATDALASLSGVTPEAAPEPADRDTPAPAAAPKKAKRPAKRKARVSSASDALRSFLRRAGAKKRPSRRKSQPWVNG